MFFTGHCFWRKLVAVLEDVGLDAVGQCYVTLKKVFCAVFVFFFTRKVLRAFNI